MVSRNSNLFLGKICVNISPCEGIQKNLWVFKYFKTKRYEKEIEIPGVSADERYKIEWNKMKVGRMTIIYLNG